MAKIRRRRKVYYHAWTGESTDKPRAGYDNVTEYVEINGFAISPPSQDGRTTLSLADGWRFLTYLPAYSDVVNGDATDSTAGMLDVRVYWYGNVQILGNIFASVSCGDGNNIYSRANGTYGQFENVYQELWGGSIVPPLPIPSQDLNTSPYV